MSNYEAIVAGHLCLDIIPDLSGVAKGQFFDAFRPGQLIQIGAATLSTGGAVSNTGLALNKLGVKTRLIAKIGDDLFGQSVRQVIRTFGSDLADGLIVDPASDTSYTLIVSPPGIDRIFLHCVGANSTFVAGDINWKTAPDARLFHLGYPPVLPRMYANSGVQLALAYYRAKQRGLTTSLDMSLPDPASEAGKVFWLDVCARTLRFVDVFLPSIEEILFMLYQPVYDQLKQQANGGDILPLITLDLLAEVSARLVRLGCKIVVLKLGERGLYMRTAGADQIAEMGRATPSDPERWANRDLWSPCFKANLVGTTGAGDATIAGFLAALLRGLGPEEAVNAAVAVGACNVEAADALGGLHTWEETMQRVADGWPKHEMCIDAEGWEFDETYRMWKKE
ncbi:MAG: carbohydrate kinase family protein [Anaerolineae bacterium]|nr:carbohydrate kinase family protein [Anaerolineae bacterium]